MTRFVCPNRVHKRINISVSAVSYEALVARVLLRPRYDRYMNDFHVLSGHDEKLKLFLLLRRSHIFIKLKQKYF
jgi:hypothetical protein